MKLRVQHEDGRMETITLVPPISVHLGTAWNHVTDASGMDHYFTEDGHYDGWGMSPPQGSSAQEAGDLIDRVEASREIG